jgi:hypothetical protein
MITNTYGPTTNSLKNSFIAEIHMISCLYDIPWILIGDFNLLQDITESTSLNPNTYFMIEFNDMIHDLDLQELQLNGRLYTWSNKRPTSSFSKLDRMLVTNHWCTMPHHIPCLTDLPTTTSDHAPLILTFKKNDTNTYRFFHFERHWLKYEEAAQVVHAAWNSVPTLNNPAICLTRKFKQVQKAIQTWANKKFNGYNKLIKRTKHIVQKMDCAEEHRMLSGQELRLRIELKEHIYRLANI